MGKKEQVPALAIFVQGVLCVWSATSRGRPPDGGLALAVFHMVPRVPAAPNLFVHPPADLRNVLLPPSSRPARLLRLTVVRPATHVSLRTPLFQAHAPRQVSHSQVDSGL